MFACRVFYENLNNNEKYHRTSLKNKWTIPIDNGGKFHSAKILYFLLSHDVASGKDITPCNKIDKPLVVYRFSGNVMTSITTLRT